MIIYSTKGDTKSVLSRQSQNYSSRKNIPFQYLEYSRNEFLLEKIKEIALSKQIKPDVEENQTIEIRSDVLNEINNAVYFSSILL